MPFKPLTDHGCAPPESAFPKLLKTISGALLSAYLLLVSGPIVAQTDGRVNWAKEAMVYKYRSNGHIGILKEQLLAIHQYQKGISPKDIRADILRLRRKRADDRKALAGDWQANEYLKTTSRLVGRIASQAMRAGSVGVEFANLLNMGYEDMKRGSATSRIVLKLSEEHRNFVEREGTQDDPEHLVAELSQEFCREDRRFCRLVWNPLFEDFYGISPVSDRNTVFSRVPEFYNHVAINQIADGQREQGELIQFVSETNRNQIIQIATIRENLESVRDYTIVSQERWAQKIKKEVERKKKQTNAIELAAHRSAVDIAATIIGFEKPDLGRQLKLVNNAVFGARKAIQKYRDLIDEFGSNAIGDKAAVILTGDYLSIGLTLMSGFANTGPPPESVILDQIVMLREEVQELRKEMHERFDALAEQMIQGFEAIHSLQLETLREIRIEAMRSRRQMIKIETILVDVWNLTIEENRRVRDLISGLSWIPRCEIPSVVPDDMTSQKFRECLGILRAIAHDIEMAPDMPPNDRAILFQNLQEHRDDSVPKALSKFTSLVEGSREPGGYSVFSGPATWSRMADMHLQLMEDYPELAPEFQNDPANQQFVLWMRSWRDALRYYMNAIQLDLKKYQEEGGAGTAIGALIDRARSERIRMLTAEWATNGGDPDADGLRAIEIEMGIINAYLRLWLGLAFEKVAGVSGVLQRIMEGEVGLPDNHEDWIWSRMDVRVEGQTDEDRRMYLAQRAKADVEGAVNDGISALENLLRSPAMRDVAAYGGGHSILTEMQFENLGVGE